MTARVPAIVVLGLMGAGKSTVATRIGELRGWPVSDSDVFVTARTDMTAGEVVEAHGQRRLHLLEAAHLLEGLASPGPRVVAAAASVVDSVDCRRALAHVPVVWLDARPSVLAARFESGGHRPRYQDELETMLDRMDRRRRGSFRSLARWHLDAEQSVADLLVEVDAIAVQLSATERGDVVVTADRLDDQG